MGIRYKPELEATKIPTALEIAWSAGVFEGEGHYNGRYGNRVTVVVTQKEPEILFKLRDWFGGRVRFAQCKKVPLSSNCHQWYACGDRARLFAALVYPWLSSKRKLQIDTHNGLAFLGGLSPELLSLEKIKEKLDSRLPFCTKNDPDKAAKKKLQKHNNYLQRRLNPEYVERIRKQSAAGNLNRRLQRLADQSAQPERIM
jgi:hypothetical protein